MSAVWKTRIAQTESTLTEIQERINALCRARKHYRVVLEFEKEQVKALESKPVGDIETIPSAVRYYDIRSRYPAEWMRSFNGGWWPR